MKCDSSHLGLENGENKNGNWRIKEEEEATTAGITVEHTVHRYELFLEIIIVSH